MRALLGSAVLLGMVAAAAVPEAAIAQQGRQRPNGQEQEEQEAKTYQDVVGEAESDEGLFTLHQIDDKLMYEIPLTMMGREMLLLTRVSKAPAGAGYGGSKSNTSVVRWERDGEKVRLRLVSHSLTADEDSNVYQAVQNSNFEPVIAAWDVEVMNDDESAVVVDVTSLFTGDVPLIGVPSRFRTQFGVRRLDGDRTYLVSANSYPRNVEVRRVVTYEATQVPSNAAANTLSAEMAHSMLLLPDDPMMPRYWDERAGFFSVQSTDFTIENQRAGTKRMITRWRLEPSDPEAFARGELVDPVKPIVYYIDPATPEKWVPYLIRGVEDWQVAFEEAGFSNAIIGRRAPTPEQDPEFSPEDARFSVIRYLASPVQNASGPHVHDPRTGEILESDIQWYHNVMNLVRNWYFVHTAAANPEARGVEYPDSVMGELIRFVAAHEVGHTLGLPHNMKASAAVTVDQLRSDWVCENGTAPTIMDYARYNYVAQPGDDTCYSPKVGPYDKYIINWGYRPIPGADSPEAEIPTLSAWIEEKGDDPLYRFGDPSRSDPSSLTEALGSNAVEASDLGILNLQRIVENLTEWTYEEGEDYSQLEELYGRVLDQWNRYTGHVATNIGGVYWNRKAQGQDGMPYIPVDRNTQRQAMDYLNRQVFATPTWMLDEDILRRIEEAGALDRISAAQAGSLNRVLNVDVMKRLVEQELFAGSDAYGLIEMLDDLREGVWSELSDGEDIDPLRRNVQRAYLNRIAVLMQDDAAWLTDAPGALRAQLLTLQTDLASARAQVSDRATEAHLIDSEDRIRAILELDRLPDPPAAPTGPPGFRRPAG
jgi:hypothetical protein